MSDIKATTFDDLNKFELSGFAKALEKLGLTHLFSQLARDESGAAAETFASVSVVQTFISLAEALSASMNQAAEALVDIDEIALEKSRIEGDLFNIQETNLNLQGQIVKLEYRLKAQKASTEEALARLDELNNENDIYLHDMESLSEKYQSAASLAVELFSQLEAQREVSKNLEAELEKSYSTPRAQDSESESIPYE